MLRRGLILDLSIALGELFLFMPMLESCASGASAIKAVLMNPFPPSRSMLTPRFAQVSASPLATPSGTNITGADKMFCPTFTNS